MKEHPILFNTEMVKAILEGRKTQTRRVVKMKKQITDPAFGYTAFTPKNHISVRGIHANGQYGESFFKCPCGQPGDRLWVRETTIRNNNSNTYWPVANGYVKTADYEKTIPSIHMPKAAARIWLEVEEARVERLESISDEDAIAEGIHYVVDKITGFCGYDYLNGGYNLMTRPWNSFLSLWRKTHGIENYKPTGNPWVWVIKFKVLSTTGASSIQKPESSIKQQQNVTL